MLDVPYCGAAPIPSDVLQMWNFDPWIVPAMVAMTALLVWSSRATLRTASSSPMGLVGCFLLLAAFISPICALSSALFSARIVHHLLLISVAAPLIALALPTRFTKMPITTLFFIHTAAVWFWHAPQPYEAAVYSMPIYWLMEMSLILSAVFLWQAIFSAHLGAALITLLGTIIQMGMLGALLTVARNPLFAPHFTTTLPFGLTPLEDQQLAGIIMWVPAVVPYMIAAICLIWQRFGAEELRSAPTR